MNITAAGTLIREAEAEVSRHRILKLRQRLIQRGVDVDNYFGRNSCKEKE